MSNQKQDKRISWDKKEEEFLIKAYNDPSFSLQTIANYLNKSTISIYKKARRLNLNRPNKTNIQLHKSILTKQEIINLYTEGTSLNSLSAYTNLGTTSIKSILEKENILIRNLENSQRKYRLNFDYFKNIDTYEKAYILGFIAADGYNNTKYNRLVLTIHNKDIDILKFIQKSLNTDTPIKYIHKKNHVSLIITNKTLSKDLNNLGIVQAKTEVLTYPSIDPKFDSSFMLGYFDGDGSIYTCKNNLTKCGFSTVGSSIFIQTYLYKLYSNCKINKAKLQITKNNNIVYFKYSGRGNILKIYNFLYQDTLKFCLRRKQNKFIDIINYKKL